MNGVLKGLLWGPFNLAMHRGGFSGAGAAVCSDGKGFSGALAKLFPGYHALGAVPCHRYVTISVIILQ